MDLDFAVLADGVTSRPDGKLDIYGAGVDTIFAAAVPARHPRLVVAVRAILSNEEAEQPHRVQLSLQAAAGEELASATAELEPVPEQVRAALLPGRPIGIGLIFNVEDVVFPEYGDYQLVLTWDGAPARPPLRLYVADRPPSPG